jgi:hypothetical protein
MAHLPFTDPTFQTLIDQGAAILGPVETSDAFNDYVVKHYDVFTSQIDWSEVSDRVSFPNIGLISDHEVILFLKITRLSPYAHIGLVSSYQEPILVVDLPTLEEHFDLLTGGWLHYLIGAEKQLNGEFAFHFEDFVEYYMGTLVGRQFFPPESDITS